MKACMIKSDCAGFFCFRRKADRFGKVKREAGKDAAQKKTPHAMHEGF
jgi:hypothetical protein